MHRSFTITSYDFTVTSADLCSISVPTTVLPRFYTASGAVKMFQSEKIAYKRLVKEKGQFRKKKVIVNVTPKVQFEVRQS